MITEMPPLFSAGEGAKLTELWTNPSPTSAMGSASAINTTVNLNQSYDNFDFLRIEYVKSTTEQTVVQTIDIDPSIMTTDGTYRYAFGTGQGIRYVYMPNAAHTTFEFGPAYGIYATTVSYTNVIPIKVYGVNV